MAGSVVGQIQLHGDTLAARLAGVEAGDLGQLRVQVERLAGQGQAAGFDLAEAEVVRHQGEDRLGIVPQAFQQIELLGVHAAEVGQHVREAEDDGEGVLDVVGEHGEEIGLLSRQVPLRRDVVRDAQNRRSCPRSGWAARGPRPRCVCASG